VQKYKKNVFRKMDLPLKFTQKRKKPLQTFLQWFFIYGEQK